MDKKPIIERPGGCSCTRWALLKGTCSSHCNYCPWSGYQPEPNDRYDMERKPPAEQVPTVGSFAPPGPSIADAIERARIKALDDCARMLSICETWTDENYKAGALSIRDRIVALKRTGPHSGEGKT